jgi:hypothetical protein
VAKAEPLGLNSQRVLDQRRREGSLRLGELVELLTVK